VANSSLVGNWFRTMPQVLLHLVLSSDPG